MLVIMVRVDENLYGTTSSNLHVHLSGYQNHLIEQRWMQCLVIRIEFRTGRNAITTRLVILSEGLASLSQGKIAEVPPGGRLWTGNIE